ncbi:MAG: hypothetical protein ABIK28_18360 [Planctomycetota bacterium]
MKIVKHFPAALYIMFVVLFVIGCGGGSSGGGGDPGAPQSPQSTTNTGLIVGIVRDSAGTPMGGVTVISGTKSTTSNEQGYFSIVDLAETDRQVILFTRSGYVNTTEIAEVHIGLSTFLEPIMMAVAKTVTFAADTAISHIETATTTGASVAIAANTLVDTSGALYSGQATVAVTGFDPTTPEGQTAFPGLFAGVNTSGQVDFLESFGFVDITFTASDGSPLQLDQAHGATADIVVPVPPSLVSAPPPATIPLWYFSESDGQWHEEGSATLNTLGTAYEGTVTHFTPWNCDRNWPWTQLSWIEGYVVDPSVTEGGAITGASVIIKGPNWTSGETSTDLNGYFQIPVVANSPVTIQASRSGVKSAIINYTTPAPGVTDNIGQIFLGGIPKVKIILKWGLNPEDLDAHLTIPDGGEYKHLYFSSSSVVSGAALDTDDTDSYGPEIISILLLHEGTYRYCVHQFAGSETITNSGATVTVEVENVGIYQFTPPTSGALGVDDNWRVVDIVISGGKVIAVNPINSLGHEVDCDDITAFTP